MIYYDGRFKIVFVKVNALNQEIIPSNKSTWKIAIRDSWKDLCLVPTEKPILSPPKPIFEYVKVPLSDQYIDLSAALRNDNTVAYEPYEGTFKFYIDYERMNLSSLKAYDFLSDYFDGTYFFIFLRNLISSDVEILVKPTENNRVEMYLLSGERAPSYGGAISVGQLESSEGYPIIELKYKLVSEPNDKNYPNIISKYANPLRSDKYIIPHPWLKDAADSTPLP